MPGPLGDLVRAYLDRAVHRHDPSAVDDYVAPGYRGHGFPADREALRAFYAFQARTAPDWRIDIEDLVEEGDKVAVRAHAYGHRTVAPDGTPYPAPVRRDLEWIAVYRFADGLIAEIWVTMRDL
jgi:predicted ester cyclase